MIERVSSHWWLFLIRGLLALALGLAMPWFPLASLFAIAILFGAYAFVDGIVAIAAAIRMNHVDASWWWLLLEGVLGIAVGLITFFYPGLTIVSLAYLLGAWAIVTGILGIISAFRLHMALPSEILWIILGALSVVFGFIVFASPLYGALALVWMISIYAIFAGLVFLGLAFRLRGLTTGPSGTVRPTT
ncbi:MAG TPA: HdeD family acid-resistance protein [Candidatus Sulfotelmatobacter sp.]|nr:HdeD family acid-resistance protein [Candidatus Sulfotelmatobacter sp.]